MTWAFDVASNIPRLNQSGTETGLANIATAIAAVPTVARSTAYTTAQMVKPPTGTGFWYRCSTAGTTSGTVPVYGTTLGGTTTDGTAVFTAFKAPDIQTLGTTNHYYMPDVRIAINGTLTNANPQQQNFTCYDIIIYTGNFTSGAWASDGVTPLWDGLHFAAVRTSASGADGTTMSLQAGGQFTFIGGEVQCAGGVTFDSGTTPRSYLTRWRNTKEWGASSSRFRSYTTNLIFQNVETYDFAYDLFRMPTVAPSIKARGSEYIYQYVGAGAGGADAKFVASNLENPDGTYDFDNYFGGWVELYNCAKGKDLNVVSQYPNSAIWVKHCVPLYQDVAITAKNTSGVAVQDVRFTCTDAPTISPTVTFTTAGGLKTWDFRNTLSYQTTTNASGIATASPVLQVWYWETSFKKNLRFPASTATFEGRAYNYKTMTTSVVLGASAAQQLSAGMIGLDTATTITETAALALTGITLTPSGATGGTITISSNHTLQDIWNYYRAWISQFANRASNDTWSCVSGKLLVGAWNIVVNSGVNVNSSPNITSIETTSTVTNNGNIYCIYASSAGTSTIWRFQNIQVGSSIIVYDSSLTTKYFQQEVATPGTYSYYIPPGVNETYYFAVEKYGKKREDGSFAANYGGTLDYFPAYADDVGISVADKAIVSAYTALENYDKLYDYIAYYRLRESAMKTGQLATRDGTSLVIGYYNLVLDGTLADLLSVNAGTISVKGSTLNNGTKYVVLVAYPPQTITANAPSLILGDIEDANGDSSITIGGGSGNFSLWKLPTSALDGDYATGVSLGTTTEAKFRFIHADGYKIIVHDLNSNINNHATMSKGNWDVGMYYGSQIQLAQNALIETIDDNVNTLLIDVEAIKGGSFNTSTDNLHAIKTALDTKASLADIEGSSVIAKQDTLSQVQLSIDSGCGC